MYCVKSSLQNFLWPHRNLFINRIVLIGDRYDPTRLHRSSRAEQSRSYPPTHVYPQYFPVIIRKPRRATFSSHRYRFSSKQLSRKKDARKYKYRVLEGFYSSCDLICVFSQTTYTMLLTVVKRLLSYLISRQLTPRSSFAIGTSNSRMAKCVKRKKFSV